MKQILLKCLNFIFPITCVECGNDLPCDDYYRICESCVSKIKMIDGHYCKKCGLDLPDGGEHCFNCAGKTKHYFESLRAACVYKDTARNLVHKLKYGGREYLDRIIGQLTWNAIAGRGLENEIDLILFVPMHGIKEYWRGYNQAELIAKKISGYMNKPLLKGLVRKKITKAQFKLNKEERVKNVKGCFGFKEELESRIKGKNLLLVDDVCTTCSTVDECSKVLRRAGAAKVYALTFARD